MSDRPTLPPGAAATAAAQSLDTAAQLGIGGSLPLTAGTPATFVPQPRPTVTEAFGAEPRPTAEEAFGPDPDAVAKSAPPGFWEGHPLLNAFRVGAEQAWGAKPLGLSPDTTDALKHAGIFNDYQNNHASLVRSFNEDIIRPAAITADLLLRRLPLAALGGLRGVAEQPYPGQVTEPQLTPDEAIGHPAGAAVRAAAGLLAGGAEAFPVGHATGFPARLPLEIARGKDLGTVPLSPEEAAAQGEALRYLDPNGVDVQTRGAPARQVYTEPAGPPEPAVTGQAVQVEAPPDINAQARLVAPEVFRQHDEAVETRQIFRDWLDELDDLRRHGSTPAVAALDRQLDEARAAALEMTPADRAGQNTLISSLEDERSRLVAQIPAVGDTAEMARVRQSLHTVDLRLRNLVPQMGEARRQAAEGPPPEAAPVAEAAPAATETPPAEPVPPTPPLAPAGAVAETTQERLARARENTSRSNFTVEKDGQSVPIQLVVRGENHPSGEAAFVETADGGQVDVSDRLKSGMSPQQAIADAFIVDDDAVKAAAPPEAPPPPIEGGIAGDVAKQLVAAGRPAEEAGAAGSVIQAHYRAWADAFPELGDPEDIYRREAPRIVAGRGVPATAEELAQKGELDQPGRGEVLYHGGRDQFDAQKASDKVYLTNDREQAGHYARGAHLGGYGEGEPRVTAIRAKPGKTVNVDDALFNAMDEGEDVGDALEKAIRDARAEGARYVEYRHPNARSEGEHTVRVSLYPKEDLLVADLEQPRRGAIRIAPGEAQNTIRLFGTADASTFIHEAGHQWLEELMKFAADERAPGQLVADAKTVRDWLGISDRAPEPAPGTIRYYHGTAYKDASGFEGKTFVTPHEDYARNYRGGPNNVLYVDVPKDEAIARGLYDEVNGYPINGSIENAASQLKPLSSTAEIPRAAHEKFARGFERYMMEGRAPSPELAGVFAKFKDWLTQIYRTVARLRAPITDDVRGVFDRMLASGEAREPAGSFADIHAADAAFTPAERAHEVAPLIRDERDRVAEATAPEIEDGRRAERDRTEDTTRRRLGRGVVVEPPGVAAGPGARPAGGVPEPGTERAGKGAAVAEGGRASGAEEGAKPAVLAAPTGGGELLDKAGNIRLDNLNTPEDVNALIREISEANGNFLSERRGTVSDGEVLRLAEAMGLRPEDLDLNRLRNEFSPERVMATRKLFVQAATEAQQLAISAQRGDPGAIMAYAQARSRLRMVQQHLAGLTAEWGRSGRAFRRIEGTDQARSVAEIMDDISDEGRELGQPAWLERLRAEAARVVRLDSPAKVAGFLHDADRPGVGAMALEIYTNWLISGPLTHVGYAAANFTLDLYKATVETAAQATVGAIAERIAGEPIPRVYYGEIGAQLYALMRGQRDGFRAAWDSLKAGQTMALPGEEAAKTVFTRQQAVPNFRVMGLPVPLGSAVRVPGERMIAPIHSYFRAIGYEQHIARLAYRQATAEGLTGDAWTRRVGDLTLHPSPEMMEAARGEATAQTLMGRGGKFTQAIQHIASVEPNLPLLGPTRPLRFVAPFVTIFGNMAEQSVIERSPLGFLAEAVRRDLRGENGPVAQQTIGGRMMAGTALAMVGGGLAMEGALVGSGPTDPKERSFWRRIYGMPHSLRIGEGSYDLSRFGVLGMQLAISADLYQTAHLALQGEMVKSGEYLVHSIAQNFLDEGFLHGVSQMMQALDDFDRYGPRYIANTAASFAVPYSVGVAQIAHQIDPSVRQARTLTDQIIAKVPWWSESLLPRRDTWGEPIRSRRWEGVYSEALSDDPVDRAFDNLGYYPSMPQRRLQGVELTDGQYDDYVRISGRAAHKEIAQVIQMPGFNALPPAQRLKLLQSTIENWRKLAATTVQQESRGTSNDITAKANAIATSALHGASLEDLKRMRTLH